MTNYVCARSVRTSDVRTNAVGTNVCKANLRINFNTSVVSTNLLYVMIRRMYKD